MDPDFFTVAKTESGDCGSDPKVLPEWVDEQKLRQGQKYYRKYLFSVYMSCLSSLCVGLSIPSLITTLLFTGETDTIPKIFRRYLRTIQCMDKWYRGDIWDTEGEAFRNVQTVRRIHKSVAKRKMVSDAASNNNSVAISQYDMVMTQLGFMGLTVAYPLKFGIRHSEREGEGFVHFWRCIGYLLGIDEKYNLCAGTYKETVEKCHVLIELELKPNLLNPPLEYEPMARKLMISLRPIIPVLDYDSYGLFTFKILNVPFERSNSTRKRKPFMYWMLQVTTNWILFIPSFRKLLNWILYRNVQRAKKYSEF